VGVSIGSGTEAVSAGGSARFSSTILAWLSSPLCSCIGSFTVSTTTNGNTIGSLDRDERDILRFRRRARPGNPLSVTESQGTCKRLLALLRDDSGENYLLVGRKVPLR
jgi:hypothetical protein